MISNMMDPGISISQDPCEKACQPPQNHAHGFNFG